MRRSVLKMYIPFVAVIAAQALFVTLMPSRGPRVARSSPPLANGGTPLAAAPGSASAGQDVPATDANGKALVGSGSATGRSGSGLQTRATAGPGSGRQTAEGPGAVTGRQGDISHCRNGRQNDVIYQAPPCVPTFVGDNGGARYKGVTAAGILVVDFDCRPNEQVNALLAKQGLATTEAERAAIDQAITAVLNAKYELYGRKITIKRVIGNCDGSNSAAIRRAAAEVVKMNPFMVLYPFGGFDAHDVWAKSGVISLGSPSQELSLYTGRRPFRWDVFMDGNQAADIVAEYYCTKLAAGKADHAGKLIHPTIGGRDTPRKAGVIVPDNGDNSTLPTANRLAASLRRCSAKDVPVLTYASDISRATEQARNIAAGMVDAKVTSVVCLCDPIAPAFLTAAMSGNNYFPEHILPGSQLLDDDRFGRLYDQSQWTHAFGPSHLANAVPFSDTDASKVWRAAGNQGDACKGCGLITDYGLLVGTMVQQAGPDLNPLTVERGMVTANYRRGGWEETRHNPNEHLTRFGPNDYTAVSDYREVYWDPAAKSALDGQVGAYVPVEGGRRYELGQLPGGLKVPSKPQ